MTFQELKELLSFSDSAGTEARWILAENYSDTQIHKIINRRKRGEPLSKILGHRCFWKGDFLVNKNVLDPRADSETLIQAVLEKFPNKDQVLHILDLGTGSGCLLISLLMEYPNAIGVGVDISPKALQIANKNASKNGVTANFILADMANLPSHFGQFDIVISNPPYISTNDINSLNKSVKNYDPLLALDGGTDGLDFYRILAKASLSAVIFVEIGFGQFEDVCQIFKQQNWTLWDTKKDFGHIERVLIFKKSL